MSDKSSEDKDGRPETFWDIGIRALIRGNVHHEADGASLHGGDSEQHDPAQPGEAGSVERPSGEDTARRRRQIRREESPAENAAGPAEATSSPDTEGA